MKRVAVFIIFFAATLSGFADYGLRSGVKPINSTASWGGNPLTDNTNYRLGSADGTTGTVSSADNFTLMGSAANVMLVGDITSSSGVISMDGGTFNLTGKLRLGAHGTGTGILNLSGGTLNVGADLEMARFNAGAVGTLNVSGGALNVTGNILVGSSSISGESAVINYTGGDISADGQFQMQDGTLNFQLGLDPISCNQRTGSSTADLALIDVIFGGGYSHVAGTTNLFITSNSQAGVFTLSTDSGNVDLDPSNHGNQVTIDGYDFEVLATSGSGGAIGVVAVNTVVIPKLKLIVITE